MSDKTPATSKRAGNPKEGSLDAPTRLALLESYRQGGIAQRASLRALLAPAKACHFDDPAIYHAVGCVYSPTTNAESPSPKRRFSFIARRSSSRS